ncbi:MAG: hypothetical protein BZY75_03540 [SAR202 cluster bacterium Io17-Chloro-G7]|nr:MAG: hypothetical protein BZY75_03540 [SAR202 cluster bacterium Io17-Chloro-G7]
MSTFRYPIEIGDASRQRFESVEVWVDTGASYTLIPRSILESLGHSPTHDRSFRLADGSVVELGLAQVPMRIGVATTMVSCAIGNDETQPFLGATALEEFGLGVDPLNHTLVPVVLNLLGFKLEEHESC